MDEQAKQELDRCLCRAGKRSASRHYDYVNRIKEGPSPVFRPPSPVKLPEGRHG